jgi:hypothetical protein
MKVTPYPFPSSQYMSEEITKTQIFLHHTAGNSNPIGVYDDWKSNPERIATCVVIGGNPGTQKSWIDGEAIKGYSSKLWAYHLGLKESTFQKFGLPYKSLDKISVAVEVCNWGQLTKKGDKFYNYVNKVVPNNEVIILDKPHRGYTYFHAYTDAQIATLKELILSWGDYYKIPLDYNEDIWDVTTRALKGESGIYTHNSVRYDKVDLSPQPKIIEMLKSLK